MADDAGIRRAERLGTCLAFENGGTCMRKLRIVKYMERDGQGNKINKKRRECKKHGADIFSPQSGRK